jgi:hypothetical protein
MSTEEIVEFLLKNVEPLPPNPPDGKRYRASATLKDGLHLPCVVFESASRVVDLAIKRFDETRRDKSLNIMMDYRAIVRTFVTSGNTVNDYDIREVGISPFAIPLAQAREIGGETSMSWTEFYAIMRDGAEFRFGTTFLMEFFEMPDGYTANDIQRIVPAVRGETPRYEKIHRERPFFTCYIDGI